MPPTVPQSARTPHQIVRWWFVEERANPGRTVANCSVETLRTDHLDWSLSAHRRRTLGGMDAATELTGTYLQRVLRW
ncbi:hypothetical protein D0A38_19755 [Xanthomonas campestris pv. incanae]|nr:hypothetical protein D0A38_19755 [Xanthomonas campestris pv. incanae]